MVKELAIAVGFSIFLCAPFLLTIVLTYLIDDFVVKFTVFVLMIISYLSFVEFLRYLVEDEKRNN